MCTLATTCVIQWSLECSRHVVYCELFDTHAVVNYQRFWTASSFFEKRPSCSFLAMLCKNIWVHGWLVDCLWEPFAIGWRWEFKDWILVLEGQWGPLHWGASFEVLRINGRGEPTATVLTYRRNRLRVWEVYHLQVNILPIILEECMEYASN
jgi:hypothetical protein